MLAPCKRLSSASAQGHFKHIGKVSQGTAISMEDAITNTVHTSEMDTSCVLYVPEELGELHVQEAAGCHQEKGESH
jgi:hypothetical protein